MAPGKSLLACRKKAALAALLAVLQGGSVLAMHLWEERPEQATITKPWTRPTKELADGDLIFRRGRDAAARMVLDQGDSVRFSHVGVVVMQGSEPFVVHAAAPEAASAQGGVLIEALADFVAQDKAADVGVYRAKGLDARQRDAISSHVRRQIGKPFDYEFRLSEDEMIYCTELALKALKAGGIDLEKTIRTVSVMVLSEPAFPPDYLRRSGALESL